jgi:hypothetical protein
MQLKEKTKHKININAPLERTFKSTEIGTIVYRIFEDYTSNNYSMVTELVF